MAYWLVTFHFLLAAAHLPAEDDIINLKVMMSLGAFNVLVCEQNRNIADIKIQGRKGRPAAVAWVTAAG